MSHQDTLRSAASKQDNTARPKHHIRSRQIEDEEEELPPRLPSSCTISSIDAEDQLTNPRKVSTHCFSLRECPIAMSRVVLNQYAETSDSPPFPPDTQPNTNAEADRAPSPHKSRPLFSGIQELSMPMSHAMPDTAEEAVAEFPTSCPTCAQSIARKPSSLHPRNSKLSSNLEPPRLQYATSLNPSSRETEKAMDTCDSETEEDSRQSSCSAVGNEMKRENTNVKIKSSETGEHTKAEFTKLPPKNQFVTNTCDAPNGCCSVHRISVNNTTVGKSGSYSIPTCATNITLSRPGSPDKDSHQPPSPRGLGLRRREISPRNFMSAVSVNSLDSKRSKIPRLVQKSARALATNGTSATTHCDYRYAVYNVFSIIMMSGSDDRADQLDSSLRPMFAAESVVEENKKCAVFEQRSYLHPAVQKIQTYEPVRISIKPSETVSAVISIEEPRVVNTFLNAAKPETSDMHVVTMTEFRDAISVYEPVVSTDELGITEQTNKPDVISAKPSAEKDVIIETSKQKIVSIIPSVVVASVQVKKQKKSKPVQPKVQPAVQSSVPPAVKSLVQPAAQSLAQLVQSGVKSSAKPAVKSSAQSVVTRSGTSSLASSVIEVSFTDLDKKAFQPQQPRTSSKEHCPNSKTKIRSSKGHSHSSTTNETKAGTTRSKSHEENLKSASRSALKAILKALLTSNGAQRPGNQKESSDDVTGLHTPSKVTVTSPFFVSPALSSSTPGPQPRFCSANAINQSRSSAVASADRTKSLSGETLGGQYPLGSSVTQVFSKHRKRHQQLNEASDNSTSWSKALYAKTLYFKDETKQNAQKQINPRSAASSMQMPPSKTNPGSSKLERSNEEDQRINRGRFHRVETTSLQKAANRPSVNSVEEILEEPYASLEKAVNEILLSRFGKSTPIQIKG